MGLVNASRDIGHYLVLTLQSHRVVPLSIQQMITLSLQVCVHQEEGGWCPDGHGGGVHSTALSLLMHDTTYLCAVNRIVL